MRDLKKLLRSRDAAARWSAAAELGQIGGREAVSALRELLEGTDPVGWEVAVHGLRHSRERDGWLCLESVALECVSMLASDHPAVRRPAAMRLLMMGRTKTMDRLFRAVDGHSRAIPRKAAVRFVRAALLSLPSEHARVVAHAQIDEGLAARHGHRYGLYVDLCVAQEIGDVGQQAYFVICHYGELLHAKNPQNERTQLVSALR